MTILAFSAVSHAQMSGVFNVGEYGAKGDGATLDTTALNATVDACSKAGGGTVYVPAGTYLTGTVLLKSNMTLWLASGATLLGSKNLADYPVSAPWTRRSVDWGYGVIEGYNWYKALVRAENVENVTILGPGVIDGNNVFNPEGEEQLRGPHAVSIDHCSNLKIRDLTIKNGSNWNLRLSNCEGVNIDGYSAMGGWDGINLSGVKDVTISNCRLFTGDDSIAADENTKNLSVTNCLMSSSANAFRFAAENSVISNILILGPGRFEHRTSRKLTTESGVQGSPHGNFVMSNVSMINVRSPFWLEYSDDRASSTHISINNLTATGLGRTPFVIYSDPAHPLKSLVLNNVRMDSIGGVSPTDSYQQGMSPYSILPWYGLYADAVEELQLHDVSLGFEQNDSRPAMYLNNVATLKLDGFEADRAEGAAPSILLSRIRHITIDRQVQPLMPLEVEGLGLGAKDITPHQSFQAQVTVRNLGREGLGEVSAQMNGQTRTMEVWLKAGETATVPFTGMVSDSSGEQTVQAGKFAQKLFVRPIPPAHPVSAPFLAFKNVEGEVQQFDDGSFYLNAAGNLAQCCLYRADMYVSAYRKGILQRNGSVITKIDNPDLRSAWAGEAGIIIRNDIADPSHSGGYLVLNASPASGYFMQWDATGSGKVNGRTPLDGYTYWPGWLKVEREDAHFRGYYSKDGETWVKVGEVDLPSASEQLDAGVFAHLSSAHFSELKVENSRAEK